MKHHHLDLLKVEMKNLLKDRKLNNHQGRRHREKTTTKRNQVPGQLRKGMVRTVQDSQVRTKNSQKTA